MDPILARKLNLVSTICFIGLGGLPHERAVFAPEGDASGGGGGSGTGTGTGGAGDAGAKPLTQADVDKIVEQRLAADRKARGAELEAAKTKAAEAEATLQKEREDWELKGKSEADKARIRAEQAAKKIEDERKAADARAAEADAKAKTAEAKLRATIVDGQVTQALVASKALPTAIKHASAAFLADLEIETDADHKITSIRLGGVSHPTLAKAAEEWLKTNSHFAEHVGGGGSRTPSGNTTGKPLHELSDEQLLRMAPSLNR